MISLWRRLSIRSKLLTMLLVASLIGAGAIIVIGLVTGREAMSEQVRERLTVVRSSKAFEIQEYLRRVAADVAIEASNATTLDAVADFTAAFGALADVDTIDCSRELNAYYEDYLDRLAERLDVRQEVSSFYPRTQAGCYLQTQYIVRGDRGSDRSAYGVVHARNHDWYTGFRETFDFYDVFLISPDGIVVYTQAKEADFATSLTFGPYRTSGLAELYRKVRDNADLAEAQFVDFTEYRPSFGLPAAFAGAPIVRDGAFLGVLAIQLPIDRINEIMNYGGEWAANGLGATGETVLVGEDGRLRSLPRTYLADSTAFVRAMQYEMPVPRYEALLRRGPLLNVEAASDNIDAAARGQTGIMSVRGYGGEEVLSAYAPLALPGGLRWTITAEMRKAEAFAAVGEFGRRMMLGLCGIVIAIVLLALLFTRVFMRPIERLTAGAERVAAGDTSTEVEVQTDDEIGHFTEVFNGMVRGIEAQKLEIAQQARTNESILTAKFPPSVAERYRNGEENIVDSFDNVTVLFADLRRTEQLSELEASEGLHLLNTLVRAFNDTAERLGMEIIRPVADGYLAVCDMNSPRLDNTRRALEMALEMHAHLRRLNQANDLGITMAIGIDHGSVSAGVIAESTSAYDVWGRAVDVTQRIAAVPDDDITGVGPAVVALVGERYRFERGPTLHMSTGEDIPVSLLTGAVDEHEQPESVERARTTRPAARAGT